MTSTQQEPATVAMGEAIARAETARVYGALVPEHHGNAQPLPRVATSDERHRLTQAVQALSTGSDHLYPQAKRGAEIRPRLSSVTRAQIEVTVARTGSLHAAMTATGCTYRAVKSVWRAMCA